MDAHEGHPTPFAPGAVELTEEQNAVAIAAAKIAVEAVGPLIEEFAERVIGRVSSIDERVSQAVDELHADAPETRLDELEARIKSFGQGGESVGDALALASHALACVRHVVAEVAKVTGAVIVLPPTPEFKGALPATIVGGAELASQL